MLNFSPQLILPFQPPMKLATSAASYHTQLQMFVQLLQIQGTPVYSLGQRLLHYLGASQLPLNTISNTRTLLPVLLFPPLTYNLCCAKGEMWLSMDHTLCLSKNAASLFSKLSLYSIYKLFHCFSTITPTPPFLSERNQINHPN